MHDVRDVRARITLRILGGETAAGSDVSGLTRALEALRALPQNDGRRVLEEDGMAVALDLRYEISELAKDVEYLGGGEAAFLRAWPPTEAERRTAGEAAESLGAGRFGAFIADRDGTINNYCARYWSSVQPAYAAVILTRFLKQRCRSGLILTSAPLLGRGGLVDVNVMPPDACHLAGSKGREYLTPGGEYGSDSLRPDQEERLAALQGELQGLLARPRFAVFARIGSGLQKKFGQVTVAVQDISGSVGTARMREWRETVLAAVARTDPEGRYFRVEDTGLDLEVLLTVEEEGGPRRFTKGDGLRFLAGRLPFDFGGEALVCGDTEADVPMLEAAADLGARVRAFFVARDRTVREAVARACPGAFFFPTPDALLFALRLMTA